MKFDKEKIEKFEKKWGTIETLFDKAVLNKKKEEYEIDRYMCKLNLADYDKELKIIDALLNDDLDDVIKIIESVYGKTIFTSDKFELIKYLLGSGYKISKSKLQKNKNLSDREKQIIIKDIEHYKDLNELFEKKKENDV